MKRDENGFKFFHCSESFKENGNIILHKVFVPDDVVGKSYRQVRLVEGFDSRLYKRFERNQKDFVFKFYCHFGSKFTDFDHVVDIIVHENVYKFFEHIKYDYKNKTVKHIDDILSDI